MMADVIAASGTQTIGIEPSAGRKLFEAPVVEDLGRLQQLTLLQGVTLEP